VEEVMTNFEAVAQNSHRKTS